MPQSEDALLFQYWDVKLHTRPLMHSGNHSSLLNCQEQDCQRTLSQGKGNLIRPHSLSLFLSFSDRDFSLVSSSRCCCAHHFFCLVFLRGPFLLPVALWQGDWWQSLNSLTVDIYQETLPGMSTLLAFLSTNRQSRQLKVSSRGKYCLRPQSVMMTQTPFFVYLFKFNSLTVHSFGRLFFYWHSTLFNRR